MTRARILHACGSRWDAADAAAALMRIDAVLNAASRPPSEVDVAIETRCHEMLRPPTGTRIAHRVSEDGTILATMTVWTNGNHGTLTFGLLGHRSILPMILTVPLGAAWFDDERLIWTTPAITERIHTILDAVRRSSDAMNEGRRSDALLHRREAGSVAKCAETVVAGCWADRGSLTGAFGTVIANTECPTPWTHASLSTHQTLGREDQFQSGAFLERSSNPGGSLLDEEGIAILEAALPWAVDVSWNPETKMPDGSPLRHMAVRPFQISTMINKWSILDSMETLRAHRVAPIPDHCIRRIGS